MSFLDRVRQMEPGNIVNSPEVKALWDKGLLWSLAHRRSYHYPYGMAFPEDPFFKYKPTHDPVPLSEIETAILCWAGCGTNGLLLNDITFVQTATTMQSFEARTVPTGCNLWYGHLLFTNDDGIFSYTPHVPTRAVEIKNRDDMAVIFQAFKDGLKQISDQPIRVGPDSPAATRGNRYWCFKPGSTTFFPVMETTLALINYLMLESNGANPKDRNRVIDDMTGKPAGNKKWIDSGYLQGPLTPLNLLDQGTISNMGAFGGATVQNIQLCAAAMGLGGHPWAGMNKIIIMGGSPTMKGLGFRFASDKNGFPYPVGIEGHFGAHLPPNMTVDQAVDDYVSMKWGPNGRYNPEVKEGQKVNYPLFCSEPRAIHRPFKDNENYVNLARKSTGYTQEAIQITKDILSYIYNTYGRIPRGADPYMYSYALEIDHIDPNLYDEYFVEGSIWAEQREHFNTWHMR
ncbi:MAG: hypothetical protein HYX87_00625 [Chloroflexi bacterium]|nr:hypothetical protein [Chloroflexota bacterium]